MDVLSFATSIKCEKDALNISNLLKNYFDYTTVTVDLTYQKNILRAEGKQVTSAKIEQTLSFLGLKCRLIN